MRARSRVPSGRSTTSEKPMTPPAPRRRARRTPRGRWASGTSSCEGAPEVEYVRSVAGIRALAHDDLPAVAALLRDHLGADAPTLPFLAATLLDHPWADEETPSLV